MTLKLIDLYKMILTCAGMAYDDEGFVFVKMDKERSPARTSDGKQIALPTLEQQMHGDNKTRVIFHPLHENIMRSGESEVISKLRSVFNIKLNYTFGAIAQSLLTLCASVADHKKLSPDQSEMLSAIKDVDEKTIMHFNLMMINSLKDSPEKSFVNIYLKRKAVFADKTYARGGVVTFPLYAELQKDQEKYYGVKLRAKDRAALIQLHEYIFPGIDQSQSYNRGSNSDIAPFTDALMNTVMSVSSKYNDILELFGPIIDSHEDLIFDCDWVDYFDNLQDFASQIRQIPMQSGNEGTTHAQAMYVTPVHVAQQPLVYHQPPPVMPGYAHQQMPAQQPSTLVVTENGVNFDSFLRANPQIAAVAMGNGQFNNFNAGMIPGNNPATRTPGWLKPDQMQQPMTQGYYPSNPVMQQNYSGQSNWGGSL